jgi:hypothetical protein
MTTRSGADCLIVQVKLTRASRPRDDQLRQSALSDLPGTVHHHDAGIDQRFSGHALGMAREQACTNIHGARLLRLTPAVGDLP